MNKLISFLLLLVPGLVYCQKDFRPGYVVKADGDTLHGFVQYRLSNKIREHCNFRLSRKGETTQYTPGELTGFGFNQNKVFVVKRLSIETEPPRTYFIESLVQGKVAAYRSGKYFFAAKDTIYKLENTVNVFRGEYGLYEQNKKQYIGILNLLFLDCPSVSKNLDDVELNEKDVIRVVREYNACSGEDFVVFKDNLAFMEMKFFVEGGVSHTNLSFTSTQYPFISQERTSMSGLAPFLGAGVEIKHPRSVENLSATAQLIFSRHTFSSQYQEETDFLVLDERVNMDYSRFRIPIGLKIRFTSHQTSPYIRFGYCYNVFLKGDFKVRQERQHKFDDWTVREEAERIEGFRAGQFWGSAGIQVSLGRYTGFLELRGELIGGRSIPGVRLIHSGPNTSLVMDGKSIEMSTLNGVVGVMF